MDANKLKVLQDIGYEVQKVCGLCRHAQLSPDGWGTCAIQSYQHLKHTGDPRQLSITRYGGCPKFKASDHALGQLAGFKQLMRG